MYELCKKNVSFYHLKNWFDYKMHFSWKRHIAKVELKVLMKQWIAAKKLFLGPKESETGLCGAVH